MEKRAITMRGMKRLARAIMNKHDCYCSVSLEYNAYRYHDGTKEVIQKLQVYTERVISRKPAYGQKINTFESIAEAKDVYHV